MRALTVAFQSTPVCNRTDTCDIACILQTLLPMLFLAAVHEALHLFSYTHHCIWSHGSYINFIKLLWDYKFIITSLKIRHFNENFILRKFGAIQ